MRRIRDDLRFLFHSKAQCCKIPIKVRSSSAQTDTCTPNGTHAVEQVSSKSSYGQQNANKPAQSTCYKSTAPEAGHVHMQSYIQIPFEATHSMCVIGHALSESVLRIFCLWFSCQAQRQHFTRTLALLCVLCHLVCASIKLPCYRVKSEAHSMSARHICI